MCFLDACFCFYLCGVLCCLVVCLLLFCQVDCLFAWWVGSVFVYVIFVSFAGLFDLVVARLSVCLLVWLILIFCLFCMCVVLCACLFVSLMFVCVLVCWSVCSCFS